MHHTTFHRRGFTLVELLVVIAIIGLLVALLLPAVQSAREASRRTACANNLKQQALGIHSYHTSDGRLPPSRISDHKATWLVLILPHVEQAAFFAEWDLARCVYDISEATRTRLVSTYVCPTRGTGRPLVNEVPDNTHNHGAGPFPCAYGDYGASTGTVPIFPSNLTDGAMPTGRINDGTALDVVQSPPVEITRPWFSVTSFNHIRDGLSNTLLIAEWTRESARSRGIYNGDNNSGLFGGPAWPISPATTDYRIGSDHPGICMVAFCDSSTRPLRADISATVLGQLVTRRGGEVVSSEDF